MQRLRVLQKKYYNELGGKSPFFRAWFGDWRSNDNTPVHIVTEKGSVRGTTKNKDTGWDIQVSGKVFNETKAHIQYNNLNARPYVDYINSIVENAVLLDSHTVPLKKAKSENSVMMHSMYALCDSGNGTELIKMYVEEMRNPNTNGTDKRSYQLQNIAKAPTASVRVQDNIPSSLTNTVSANVYTISDLFKIVKQFDKNFNPVPSSKVVNEDGTPKIMYRGGNEEINIFDRKKSSYSNLYGRGFYFTDSKGHASQYGGAKEYYLDIKNPLEQNSDNISKDQMRKFLEAVAENEDDYDIWNYGTTEIDEILDGLYGKGGFEMLQDVSATAIGDLVEATELFNKVNGTNYDGFILPTETVVFNSNQIKSATDNIGTFDKTNPDIRYSLEKNSGENIFTADKTESEKYAAQIDNWLAGKMKSSEHFELGQTPAVLRELGADSLPVIMSQDVMVKITGRKHNISTDEIKNIPGAIADPIMVFKSATVDNAYLVMTELTDKSGNDVVVALHLNRKQGFNKVNRIASVYGKDNVGRFIEKQTSIGNLKYIDKNKSQEWLRSRGLRLPKLNTILSSNNNILQKEDIVNRYDEQNQIKYSLEGEMASYLSEIRTEMLEPIEAGYGDGEALVLSRSTEQRIERIINSVLNDDKNIQNAAEEITDCIISNGKTRGKDTADIEKNLEIIRKNLGRKIKITNSMDAELETRYGDRKAVYKRLFGGGTQSIDMLCDEFVQEMPEYFSSDIMTDYEQFQRVIDVYEQLRAEAKEKNKVGFFDGIEDAE